MGSKDQSVIIVGAGVFGLSTALHLQKRGYKNIRIFDKQDFHVSSYSPFKGGDSPSSDTQKIIRSAYGRKEALQDLASRAITEWKQWNKDSGQELFVNAGWARLTDAGRPQEIDIETFQTMKKAGLGHTQYFIQSPEDEERALRDGWAGPRLDQFRRKERKLPLDGVFDSKAGIVQADLACNYALRLVEAAGAITFFGEGRGEFLTFIRDEKDNHQIKGIVTRDQQRHHAELVIIAAGAHSHQIVPELQSFLTATAGNFVYIKVPEELKHRFEAKVFPPWTWNYTGASDGGGLGGFPLDRNGYLKFSYRSPKWTNLVESHSKGSPISVPPTESEIASNGGAPLGPVQEVKQFVREQLPELVGAEIVSAKLCWYADTIDLDFVIDYVPSTTGLLVVTGGANHGFKFLPVLGQYAVDVIEGVESEYTRLWRWRVPTEDQTKALFQSNSAKETDWRSQELVGSGKIQW